MGYRLRSHTFDVKIQLYLYHGNPIPIQDARHRESILMDDPDAQFVIETATFAHWDFDLKSQIDMESTIIDHSTQMHYISPVKKRRLKWRYLLRDWTLTEDDGTKIDVLLDPVNKRLAEDFYRDAICGPRAIDPTILEAFMNRADLVLEWGMDPEQVNDIDPKP